jgi:hypothetical protein
MVDKLDDPVCGPGALRVVDAGVSGAHDPREG